jgi:hypothetical protein
MKNLVKYALSIAAFAFLVTACSETYELGEGYHFTDDQISLSVTQGADKWTYNVVATININKEVTPYYAEIRYGDGQITKEYTTTHEYVNAEPTSYEVQLLVYNPNGEVITKKHTVNIDELNPRSVTDDPASVQFALTGGKDNTAGKLWRIDPTGTKMVNPANHGEVWWDFGPTASLADDEFTFTPNSNKPNGGFAYDNKGGTFCNESLAGLFADGDPAGSFTTVNYTQPAGATWEIVVEDGLNYLVIKKGFLGYPIAPEDLTEAKYEVISYTPSKIVCIYHTGVDWMFTLVTEVAEDPLTGTGTKVWKIDGYNQVLAEVVAATGLNLKGFMGLGPANSYSMEWWGAAAGDKSPESTLAANGYAWQLYSWTFAFGSDMKLTITPGSDNIGFGRKAYDGQTFTSTIIEGDDMLFPYSGGTYSYTKGPAPTGANANVTGVITIGGDGFMGYYTGTQDYEIVYLSKTALCLRTYNTVEAHDWLFIYIPEADYVAS